MVLRDAQEMHKHQRDDILGWEEGSDGINPSGSERKRHESYNIYSYMIIDVVLVEGDVYEK